MDTNETSITLQTNGGTIYAPDWQAIAGLFAKIALAQTSASAVKQDKKHGQGFTYTSWAETVAVVGDALAAAKLAFAANITDAQRGEKVANVRMCFTLADVTSGAMIQTTWQADGQDITKATTTATKHWLTKTFLLTDHDDAPPQLTGQQTDKTTSAQPAARTVDTATGEIHQPTAPAPAITPPAKPAINSQIPQPPDASAPNARKWSWFVTAAKAAGWTQPDLRRWLQHGYNVTEPPMLNGQTDAAMHALYAYLTTPADIPA
jgi:hypothetical protein